MFLHDQATLLGTERRQAKAEGREEGLEEGRKKGLAEGREEGIEEGREKGAYTKAVETARKLAGRGMTAPEIAEITGLSEKEVSKIVG